MLYVFIVCVRVCTGFLFAQRVVNFFSSRKIVRKTNAWKKKTLADIVQSQRLGLEGYDRVCTNEIGRSVISKYNVKKIIATSEVKIVSTQ